MYSLTVGTKSNNNKRSEVHPEDPNYEELAEAVRKLYLAGKPMKDIGYKLKLTRTCVKEMLGRI